MTPFYTDYDSLFERFSIMTVDGHILDDTALKILAEQTQPYLIAKLCKFLQEQESGK